MAFKIGDKVHLKPVRGQISAPKKLVVEFVYERGLTQHMMCSFLEEPWTPIMCNSDFLEYTK